MTDFLKDNTTGKKFIIQTCHYCDNETYPTGKPIDPNDRNARRTEKGDYKCGDCVGEDNVKLNMGVLGRDHPMIKDYLQKQQKEIDSWNKYARAINHTNKRLWNERYFKHEKESLSVI